MAHVVVTDMLKAFSGRRVLVTGHTGFKGAWLTLWLSRLGAEVHGYALDPPTQPSLFEVARVDQALASDSRADVRDRISLRESVEHAKPDAVFHLAAQSLVRPSYTAPLDTFDVNVIGTGAVLDAVREASRPCAVVIATSDKCYDNREQIWGYRETEPLGGSDPYSASKGAAEILVASYRRSFFAPERMAAHGVRLATVRAGNVIGGGDWATDRVIPDAARALAAGGIVPVRNPEAVRPWQHVLDPLSGYLAVAARMLSSDDPCWCSAWNFGPAPGGEVPVRHLMDLFCRHWGKGNWEARFNPQDPHEANILRLSIEKARHVLGWTPRWELADAVERTAEWYREYYTQPTDTAGHRERCINDISAYEAI